MGAKFPTERICQPKPGCQKRTPKIGVRFWQHTLGCQIRSDGNLAPIVGGRTKLLHSKHARTHSLVFAHPKIDADPIFRSLTQHQI